MSASCNLPGTQCCGTRPTHPLVRHYTGCWYRAIGTDDNDQSLMLMVFAPCSDGAEHTEKDCWCNPIVQKLPVHEDKRAALGADKLHVIIHQPKPIATN